MPKFLSASAAADDPVALNANAVAGAIEIALYLRVEYRAPFIDTVQQTLRRSAGMGIIAVSVTHRVGGNEQLSVRRGSSSGIVDLVFVGGPPVQFPDRTHSGTPGIRKRTQGLRKNSPVRPLRAQRAHR
jgi:hypothetical protein